MSEPAFPQHPSQMVERERVWGDPGLTKREWFAGMALAGLATQTTGVRDREHAAEMCFAMADAMIEASKEPEP